MSLWRQLTRGLRVLTESGGRRPGRRRRGRSTTSSRRPTRYVARGLSPEDARRAARLELGGTTVVREQVRAYGWENAGRHACSPTCATPRAGCAPARASPPSACVTLALGIGATHGHLQRRQSDPVRAAALSAGRPHRSWSRTRRADGDRASTSPSAPIASSLERSHVFEALAVMRPWQPTITGRAEPERLDGQRVSADYFRVLGVPPAIGRDFAAADDASTAAGRRSSATRSGAGASPPTPRSSAARSRSTTTPTPSSA